LKNLLLILLLPILAQADIQRVNEEIRLPYWESSILSGDPNQLNEYLRIFIKELQSIQDDMKSSINLSININDTDVRYFGSRDDEGSFSDGDWRIIKIGTDDFEIQKLISSNWTQMSKWAESGGFEYLTTISDSGSSFDITSGVITGAVSLTASGTVTGGTITDGSATMKSGVLTATTVTDGTFTTTGGATSTSALVVSTSLTVTDSLVATSSAITFTPDLTITRTQASGDVGLDIINLSRDAGSSTSILLNTGTQTGFSITKYGPSGPGGTLNNTLVFNNADGDILWQSATDSITGHYWTDADGGANILEIDTTNELINTAPKFRVGTAAAELESVVAGPYISLGGVNPEFFLYDSGGPVDEKYVGFFNTGTQFQIRCLNDAIDAAGQIMVVERTAEVVDSVTFPSGGIIFSGTATTGLDMSGGTYTNIQKWPAGTIQTTGTTIFQTLADSTTAYQWLDQDGGTPILNIDTTNERVGIGTDSPEADFHIINSGGEAQLLLQSLATSDATIRIRNGSSSKWTFGNDASNDEFVISTGSILGTPKLTILQDGKAGFGTGATAPNAPLEVKGIKPGVVGGWQGGQFQVTGSVTDEFYSAVITGHNAFDTNTQLWYLGSTSASSHNDIGFINRQNAAMHFSTNNATRMTIDAAGDATFTGSVTAPNAVLNGTTAIGLDFTGTFATAIQKWPAGTISTAGTTIFQPAADSITAFQWDQADGTNFVTFDSTNKRIGVNKANPAEAVDVVGDIKTDQDLHVGDDIFLTGASSQVQFQGGDGLVSSNSRLSILIDVDNNQSDRYFRVRHDTGTTLLHISETSTAGFYEGAPETALEITHAAPTITGHVNTESDADNSGAWILRGKREDGAGTETESGTITMSHDGAGVNDQLAKMVLGVNTGAGAVDALTIDSAARVIAELGVFSMSETTTPTAIANNGAIYTKNTNTLWFQDGAGTEHLLHGDSFSNIWYHGSSTVEVTISTQNAFAIIDSFTVVGHSDDLLNAVGSSANNNITLSALGVGEYQISYHGSATATGGADKEMIFTLGITLATPKDITNVTDDTVTPIVITSVAHGLENGDMVEIVGVVGNTAANGSFIVDSKADDTFQIVDLAGGATTGNGDYNEGSPTGDVTILYPGNMVVHRMVRGADLGALSATGIHILAASDVMSVYVANVSGTTNLTVAAFSFELARIGD